MKVRRVVLCITRFPATYRCCPSRKTKPKSNPPKSQNHGKSSGSRIISGSEHQETLLSVRNIFPDDFRSIRGCFARIVDAKLPWIIQNPFGTATGRHGSLGRLYSPELDFGQIFGFSPTLVTSCTAAGRSCAIMSRGTAV